MEMSVLDLSSSLGLVATVLLTINLLLGMLLSAAYKKQPFWKKIPARFKKISLFTLHNWTAYIALVCVLAHALLLLFDPATKFTTPNVFLPFTAPHQPVFVALGTVSLYAVIAVILTSQKKLRKKLSFRTWKNLHLVSYVTALLFIIHGIALDPLLKDRAVDFFDGEKLISEFCAIVLIAATVLRWRHYVQHSRQKEKKSTTASTPV